MSLLADNIKFLEGPDTIVSVDEMTIFELINLAEKHSHSLENLLLYNLEARSLPWNQIQFVFLDVDGVLTEGGMFYTDQGDEFKRFDTKDGMAIKMAMKAGLKFGIISSGVNAAIIQHRADMFGIEHVYVGTKPKLEIAEQWLLNLGLSWEQTGYVGDDINDLQMFEKCGLTACPADATQPIKKSSDFILQSKGGHGCIREFLRYHPLLKETL